MASDVRKVKPRRLSVFDLPTVDPTIFSQSKRRSSVVSVFQGRHTSPNVVSQNGKLSSNLRLHDWNRFGWDTKTAPDTHRKKNIFLTRSRTDIEDGLSRQSSKASFPTSPTKPGGPSVFLSLPALPSNGRGDPMLRRPTLTPATPVSENGDLFIMLNKGKELKPYSFMGDDVKTTAFYDTHYPLLLGKLSDNADAEPATNKGLTEKQVKERLRNNTANRRLVKMRQRMNETERQLLDLERHNDGDTMVTELRDDTFNPLLWTWNVARYRLLSKAAES